MTSSMGFLSLAQGRPLPVPTATAAAVDSHSSSARFPGLAQPKIFNYRSRPNSKSDCPKSRQDLHTVRATLATSRPSSSKGGGEGSVCSPPESTSVAVEDSPSQRQLDLDLRSTLSSRKGERFEEKVLPPAATADVESPLSAAKGIRAPQQQLRRRREDSPSAPAAAGRGFFKTLANNLCNGLEDIIRRGENPPAHADPKNSVMNKNTYFAPIPDETPVYRDLEVTGELPACMEGVYLRTGPNPQLTPSGGYCFFDGDGMLHSVRIKDGKASYCARFVRTSRFEQERAAQQPLFIKPFGELHGMSGIARMLLFGLRASLGLVDVSRGWGAANTGLTFFDKHLLAMSEDDLPYIIRVKEDGDLETLGRYDLNGQLSRAMTSHPKVDPVTGELFSITSDFGAAPYLKYFVVSPDGVKGPDVPINIKEPMIAHDFAVTENYAVLPDLDLVISMNSMVLGGAAIGFDKGKVSRLGVLPRYATDDEQIQWFELPESFSFHYWTAWEEGDEIVLTGSILVPAEKFFTTQRLDLRYELTEIRLNRATGVASKRALVPELNLESGQINQRFYGRKCRYVYFGLLEALPTWVRLTGVAKIDLEAAMENSVDSSSGPVVGIRDFIQEGCLGSEPFFVPRTADPDAAEDDGYLVTYVHHEATGLSELLILDARSPTLETVASVKLPARVPYGLHGIFVSEETLSKQEY
ncbi:9-cis-epoxycarotenoid dioxygenase [Marchantia polymorpha subsp. ruderalis]